MVERGVVVVGSGVGVEAEHAGQGGLADGGRGVALPVRASAGGSRPARLQARVRFTAGGCAASLAPTFGDRGLTHGVLSTLVVQRPLKLIFLVSI